MLTPGLSVSGERISLFQYIIIWSETDLSAVLALITNCVILRKLHNFSEPLFLICKFETQVVLTSHGYLDN